MVELVLCPNGGNGEGGIKEQWNKKKKRTEKGTSVKRGGEVKRTGGNFPPSLHFGICE